MTPGSDDERRLLEAARAWAAGDPDPETRAEMAALIESRDVAEIAERLHPPLSFGTAGLRGVVGAGPARMNRAVVIRTTRALAEYLIRHEPDARSRPVVVGFDARASGRALAEATVGVLAAAGIPVRYFERPVPTPVVAHALRGLGATAGIVVTASHNPPEYNGYKLYGASGVQIVPPVDAEIAALVERGPPATDCPRVEDPLAHDRVESVPASFADRYLADIGALKTGAPADRDLKIVYTPLHGVGAEWVERALEVAGYGNVHTVASQRAPDGAFPTVAFPNPEEAGALDAALADAERLTADLVIANDPDADRLGACVPTASGRWIPLTGNDIGILLADYVLGRTAVPSRPLVVSSVVSSPMLESIAAAYGARFEQTLTGFKWIWTAALALEEAEGVRFVYGYEEALGYCVGGAVRDKDGIGAALVLSELAAELRAKGTTLRERLAELYRRHGLWVSAQRSVVRPGARGARVIAESVDRLAAETPASIDGLEVSSHRDFRRDIADRPSWLGAANLIELRIHGGRILVRPSGTEPKLKIYVDLSAASAPGSSTGGRDDLERRARTLADELARWLVSDEDANQTSSS